MLTLDTNILIAYLGGEEKVVDQIQEWRQQSLALFISTITECEILSYPNLTPSEEERIEKFLKENFISFNFDGYLAREAASIRRIAPSLKLPDAAIAALALEKNTALITRNIRDFQKVPYLEIATI